ncbi:NADH dehydrogenase [ubiquinone] 1 alpha subcomplex subunit 5-like isoform X1 [Theropithecus gelada]|uniref:NADH dehydrogenase [ubiquinone] 1 alpha subcomplex subunit 5-like isoform X1 n=1 Tax=Theropithecus gelada TaxID=9565 RepID=UPI000DC1AC9B|nr:NADH dehydrogenase [ubiquinone] 1 alpha subcomplex subunit 5-like isoform X1 [Theropithecus gelada]
MAGVLKKTTGLVGLAVCNTPHERLSILYTKILDVLAEIPKNAAYRKYTEQITNEKLAMVKAAEHELILARKMRDWKPWEPLVEEPPADQWKWPI